MVYLHLVSSSDMAFTFTYICTGLYSITKKSKLDVDRQRDDEASPMSTYRCMLRPILEC